jgi:hypothetical protein
MLVTNSITDDLQSLDIPEGLIDLILENSLNRERLLRMSVDDLACLLSIDMEAAKIIHNSVRKKSSSWMIQEMTELG